MSRKKITIGLFGFGCVGTGLYEVLQKTPGLKAHIKRICIKHPDKSRPLPQHYFTLEKDDILTDPDINVVVELIDNADAAFEIVSTALKNGKAVVSANKKMIAEHFEELLDLQRQYNVPFLYEASCCASIPIIRNLEEYYDNDLLESIEGVVNGSTNYILTRIAKENLSYAEALQQAQQLGYAESDPRLDTGGFDAKYKLLILMAHAFGIVTTPEKIFNLGIDALGETELAYAREKGYKIKLVAHACRTVDGRIRSFVLPKFVIPESHLYNLDDVYNGIITKTSFADTQFFVGKGAGAHPTASAVLSDISALSYDYRYEYKKLNTTDTLQTKGDIFLKVFLRHRTIDRYEVEPVFEEVEASYSNRSDSYTIGTMTLENLQSVIHWAGGSASVVLIDIAPESTFTDAEVSLLSYLEEENESERHHSTLQYRA